MERDIGGLLRNVPPCCFMWQKPWWRILRRRRHSWLSEKVERTSLIADPNRRHLLLTDGNRNGSVGFLIQDWWTLPLWAFTMIRQFIVVGIQSPLRWSRNCRNLQTS